MQKSNRANSSFRRLVRLNAWAVLSLACVVYAGGASAQVLVHDQGVITGNQEGFQSQLAKTVSQYEKQIQQFKTQVDQYTTQLQQYEQMLTSIMNISNNLSLAPNQLQEVTDIDPLIQGKCSGAAGVGSLVSSVMNSMSSLMTQSITETQKMICAQIVTTQVHKYNQTIEMLNKLQGYSAHFKVIDDALTTNDKSGDREQVTAQAANYNNAVATDMGNWKAQMEADDAVISTLENQQSILGHVALKGSSTVLGNVIQATTFAAAFH